MILVTKTYLPPLEEYVEYLKGIWNRGWVTNHGPLVLELEKKLKNYLKAKHVFLVANGTIGLQIALKCLEPSGEIITTPFSYVATTSSIIWENFKPIFVDIDKKSLCIDTSKIEKAISKNTRAILAVHVYGNPCNIQAIEKISKNHKIKVIYDAAHAFGVYYKRRSISSYGDMSVFSFHATKIFHTVEGGAIVTNDDNLAHKISYMRNFGHNGPYDFFGVGINGKNSELHAAMGLCILPKINYLINARKKASKIYDGLLPTLTKPLFQKEAKFNYGYYPIILKNEIEVLKVIEALKKEKIFPRRYFYPSLNNLNYVEKKSFPIADSISKKILCLPLHHDLSLVDLKKISDIVKNVLSSL